MRKYSEKVRIAEQIVEHRWLRWDNIELAREILEKGPPQPARYEQERDKLAKSMRDYVTLISSSVC
jgi:hypothetical protein